jgi:hypothetical protein
MREAEIDGDAAALLFGEAVGVGSGQRFDKGCFTVVNMTGRADNDLPHSAPFSIV